MKSNNVTFNLNFNGGSEETDIQIEQSNAGFPTIVNSADTIDRMIQGAGSAEKIEEILKKGGLESVSVNPYLASNFSLPAPYSRIIGDSCISLPSILKGYGQELRRSTFEQGQALGVLVGNKGVIVPVLKLEKSAGKSDAVREGDDFTLEFRSSTGKALGKFPMGVIDTDPGGTVIMKGKCKCTITLTIEKEPKIDAGHEEN